LGTVRTANSDQPERLSRKFVNFAIELHGALDSCSIGLEAHQPKSRQCGQVFKTVSGRRGRDWLSPTLSDAKRLDPFTRAGEIGGHHRQSADLRGRGHSPIESDGQRDLGLHERRVRTIPSLPKGISLATDLRACLKGRRRPGFVLRHEEVVTLSGQRAMFTT
jgi:hypothetical protein